MKWLILVLVMGAVFATPAQATHNDDNCYQWASQDSWHPDAPGSYSSYNCDGLGGDYVQVNGRGLYSGTVHHTLIHAHHSNCYLGIWWTCDTTKHNHAHSHG